MPRDTKSVKLDPAAKERLKELQKELKTQGLPPYVDQPDILSALVLYTPVPQLAGMLAEYWRYTDDSSRAVGEASEDQPATGDEGETTT